MTSLGMLPTTRLPIGKKPPNGSVWGSSLLSSAPVQIGSNGCKPVGRVTRGTLGSGIWIGERGLPAASNDLPKLNLGVSHGHLTGRR